MKTHDTYAYKKEIEIEETTIEFNNNIKWFKLFSKLEKAQSMKLLEGYHTLKSNWKSGEFDRVNELFENQLK